MKAKAWLTILLLVQLAAGAFAGIGPVQQKADRAGGASAWHAANKITLKVVDKGSTAEWELETNDEGDLVLRVNEQSPRVKQAGVIMVIAGSRLLAKGLNLVPNQEVDALDAPLLIINLAIELLARVFPKGPGSVGISTSISLVEDSDTLSIKTTSAGADFSPPWSVKGVARSVSPTVVDFDFSFTYSDSTTSETVPLTGRWEISQSKLALADDLPLRDWQVYSLGPISKSFSDGGIYDYGTEPMKRVSTLGELRKTINGTRPAPTLMPAPQTSATSTGRKTPKLSTDQ